jgi:SNW domain-containing protein 1
MHLIEIFSCAHAVLIQALARPDEEEVEKTVEETQAALERLVQNKLAHTNPATLPAGPGGPQYIKVGQSGASTASTVSQ